MRVPTVKWVCGIVEVPPEDTPDFELLNKPVLVQLTFVNIHNQDHLIFRSWILYAAGLAVDEDPFCLLVEGLGPCLSYCCW